MAAFKLGEEIRGDDGQRYRIGKLLGQGGFGKVYLADQVTARHKVFGDPVCVKECTSRLDWLGESYFGELLSANARVVRVQDAFVSVVSTARRQSRRYTLVLEYMAEGTLLDSFDGSESARWNEKHARAELVGLLKFLGDMHSKGITHRDIKPDNVYLKKRKLVLGDFGISKQRLSSSSGGVSFLNADFSPPDLGLRSWSPSDDVYQIGLLAISLLTGEVASALSMRPGALKNLRATDDFKSWLWHALGDRPNRFSDADDALDALVSRSLVGVTKAPPKSLADHNIVFTGRLPDMVRTDAAKRARAAGADVQDDVNGQTTIVVRGSLAATLGSSEGTKLFSVRERVRRGQRIRVISPAQFAKALGV